MLVWVYVQKMNKGGFMKNIEDILIKINQNPGINQRSLANLGKLSLGKVNSVIEDIEHNKFIKKEINGREHRYFITDAGLEFLERKLIRDQETIIDLHINNEQNISNAVILAAGKNNYFSNPVCLQSLGEQLIIERMIEQLRYLKIENIIVVGGYGVESLRHELSEDILLITNDDYKWTGTMASLAKAYPYVQDDFLLIESDIVVETLGLKQLVDDENRDCVLITAESGSGDEAFVEIKNHRLFKISKDIAQLNRIDGEMIGISKLSYEFFKKMMEFYEDNKNPYLNYEYLMLDVARTYKLGYNKVDNLLWHEVDNQEHLNLVKDKLMKRIYKKEQMLHLELLREIVQDCLGIETSLIRDISPIGGMTNKNYKVITADQVYVLRIPGNGTDKMISRTAEIKNASLAHEIGVDAELIYFNEVTGIKISKFIDNAQTLSAEASKKPYVMKKICEVLNKLHKCGLTMENEFQVYEKIDEYECLLNNLKGDYYDDYSQVKNQVILLKEIMQQLDVELVPCHNDTLAENFIKDENERFYLIDWEYAGMNDPMWDIAAHCLESQFNEDEEELFLNTYFNSVPGEKYKIRILINKIYQDFLWSLWTKVKEASGDDFGTYGLERYNRAKHNLKLLANQLEGSK